jgi:transcription initiation factor IIE alpha subunit
MPIVIDITDDRLFKVGKQTGKNETLTEAIKNLLQFGKLTDKEIADALKVKLEEVLAIKKEMKK